MIKRIAIGALAILTVGWVARLEWKANTERDLAGYILSHGPSPGVYTDVLIFKDTHGEVEVQGERYFVLQAYRSNGVSSAMTAELAGKPMRVITERSVDGVLWTATATNEFGPSYALEFFRLRIER